MSDFRPVPDPSPGTVQTLDCTEPEVGSAGSTCIDNWGLDRIGEESLPFDFRYEWPMNGVSRRIYVIDTGVRETHREFERFLGNSRVEHLFNATVDPDGDIHGHGTHVAAIAAGRTYGVAKWATIYRVQIVENAGQNSELPWMISGLQAIGNHLTKNPTSGIAVINWSGANIFELAVGGNKQHAMVRQELVDLLEAHPNLLLVQSAGNDGVDACVRSFGNDSSFPTVFDQILIIGGINPSYERLDDGVVSSNFGDCVDIFAPAALVVSAFKSHDNAACELSGTSMAAPHVSGAAVLLSELFPTEDAAGVHDLIVGSATLDALDSLNLGAGSPNRLLALPASYPVIFDDDFNGLGNWPINDEVGQGVNSTCFGYCAHIESAAGDAAYLGDDRPDSEYVYRVAFVLNKGDLTFGPNSEVTLLRARGANDTTLFEVLLETGPASFAEAYPGLRVIAQTNSGPVEAFVELSGDGSLIDPSLQLELEWVPSAFDTESKGFFRLWSGHVVLQNIQLQISLDNLDTYGMTVESTFLGIVNASGLVEGELRFTNFKSRREDLGISF